MNKSYKSLDEFMHDESICSEDKEMVSEILNNLKNKPCSDKNGQISFDALIAKARQTEED